MEYFKFLRKESKEFDRQLLVAGTFSGGVSTLLIFTLTEAASKISRDGSAFTQLFIAGLSLVAFFLSKRFTLNRTTVVVEDIIRNVRLRIAQKLVCSDLASLEALGKAPFFNVISMHAGVISRATPAIIGAGSSLVLLCCAMLAILLLSSTAFFLLIVTNAVLILSFYANQNELGAEQDDVARQENKLIKSFESLLDGFKELKINSRKRSDFFEAEICSQTEACRQHRVGAGLVINQSVLLGSNSLYVVLIVLILLLPIVAPGDSVNLARIATLIVFIFGPFGEVVGAYPQISEASASIREIYRIESKLDSIFEMDAMCPGQPVAEADALAAPSSVLFESIVCRQLSFKFHDEKGAPTFSLEPFDFDLKRGELVFVTGGNGSGKSTFMRVLTTLYPQEQGQILFNNQLIGAHNRNEYRELFSPIFADFHLFDQLYGIDQIDKGQIASLLGLAELQHKTSIEGKKITNTQLSTGQRKRLALLLALMEDKPILLLDEWAADQDPVFRRKFYREILPDLKRSGKTIIAVSHDDEYYDVADRVLKMEFGKFVQVSMVQTPE